jgi:starch-binding outer membrane protein, SusD/RagB family
MNKKSNYIINACLLLNKCHSLWNTSIFRVKYLKLTLILGVICFAFAGCKKLVEVEPPVNKANGEGVFLNDATATSVLTGLYSKLSSAGLNSSSISLPAIVLYGGLSSDELALWSGVTDARKIAFYKNNLVSSPTLSYGGEFWSWSSIFTCNSVVEELSGNTILKPATRRQLLGEAKFMRAFYYFYLVNLYGDLPLVLSTDYKENAVLSRSPKSEIYKQIINDLNDAKDLLSPNYLNSDLITTTTERVRPTQWAANALLARAYLYVNDYVNAEEQASLVINNKSLFDTVAINNVFLKNSKEAIWQLQPVNTGWNTEISKLFIMSSNGPNNSSSTVSGNPVYLSSHLVTAFELNDKRRVNGNWVKSVTTANGSTYFFPFKYKSKTFEAPVTEYLMVFRLAEQYLIRSEARAQQNNIAGAQLDLNIIRTRAGLQNTSADAKESILLAIQKERQVELFTEWADRWLNLKRTGEINSVMNVVASQKGSTWNQFKSEYPLPYRETQVNLNLIQNYGY